MEQPVDGLGRRGQGDRRVPHLARERGRHHGVGDRRVLAQRGEGVKEAAIAQRPVRGPDVIDICREDARDPPGGQHVEGRDDPLGLRCATVAPVCALLRVPRPGQMRGGEHKVTASPAVAQPHPEQAGGVVEDPHVLRPVVAVREHRAAPPQVALPCPTGKWVFHPLVVGERLIDNMPRPRPQLLGGQEVGLPQPEERAQRRFAFGSVGISPEVVGHAHECRVAEGHSFCLPFQGGRHDHSARAARAPGTVGALYVTSREPASPTSRIVTEQLGAGRAAHGRGSGAPTPRRPRHGSAHRG